MTQASPAITRPRPVDEPALRLFVFHHAGGSHVPYRGWVPQFPADWDICLLEAPGRGFSAGQPCLDSAGRLVEHFAGELRPWLDGPFAFFGHSMGALVSYELTRHLHRERLPAPRWLGLSAFGAPGTAAPLRQRNRHLMSDQELRGLLTLMGDVPAELLADEAMWRMFEPIFRSDFQLVDTWRPDPALPPLAVPLSVYGGTEDIVSEPARVAAWSGHAERLIGPHFYPGGHFYLSAHQRELIGQIVADLTGVLRNG